MIEANLEQEKSKSLVEALQRLLPVAEQEAYRLSELARAEFEYVEACDEAWEAINKAKELIVSNDPATKP